MPDKKKNPVPGADADNARREREKSISDTKSAEERQAQEHARDDIKGEGVDRASNAAMGHRPVG